VLIVAAASAAVVAVDDAVFAGGVHVGADVDGVVDGDVDVAAVVEEGFPSLLLYSFPPGLLLLRPLCKFVMFLMMVVMWAVGVGAGVGVIIAVV